MSATATTMHDFIVALQTRTPRDLHPCAQVHLHELFSDMRDAVDAPAEVLRLAVLVRSRVARELVFEAENAETFGNYRRGWKLRRAAAKFGAESHDG